MSVKDDSNINIASPAGYPVGYVDLSIEFGNLAMPDGSVNKNALTIEKPQKLVDTEIRITRERDKIRFFAGLPAR